VVRGKENRQKVEGGEEFRVRERAFIFPKGNICTKSLLLLLLPSGFSKELLVNNIFRLLPNAEGRVGGEQVNDRPDERGQPFSAHPFKGRPNDVQRRNNRLGIYTLGPATAGASFLGLSGLEFDGLAVNPRQGGFPPVCQ
jgi:hypothetical protein